MIGGLVEFSKEETTEEMPCLETEDAVMFGYKADYVNHHPNEQIKQLPIIKWNMAYIFHYAQASYPIGYVI